MSVILPENWGNIAGTGKSMNQLGDEWSIRAYKIPTEENPFANEDLTDPRGRLGSVEKAGTEQTNPIFFLGGSFVPSPPEAEGNFNPKRTILVPDGAVLVFPLISGILPDAPPIEDPIENTPENEAEVRTRANGFFEPPNTIKAEVFVDGHSVSSVGDSARNNGFRRESPEGGFSYTLPEDNIQDLLTEDNVPAQNIPLAVADGYWFVFDTESLSPDVDHTIQFVAGIDFDKDPNADFEADFSLDVIYNILNPIIGTNKGEPISGTEFNDYIVGGDGNDDLTGLGGNDLIVGGNGQDTIDGGIGDDELWGDSDQDIFIYRLGYGKDTIFDFEPQENVELEGFSEDPDDISDVTLPSGVKAAQIDFNGSDILTFVGVESEDLSVNLAEGTITLL